jgi:hypothetical protein
VGSEVFVSRCGGSAIDVIDVTTLTVSNSITTPFPNDCDLGYGGGLLIFSETTPGGHRMVTLDPTTETFWEGTDEFAPAVLTSSPSNTVSTISELLDMTTQPPTSLGATPGYRWQPVRRRAGARRYPGVHRHRQPAVRGHRVRGLGDPDPDPVVSAGQLAPTRWRSAPAACSSPPGSMPPART